MKRTHYWQIIDTIREAKSCGVANLKIRNKIYRIVEKQKLVDNFYQYTSTYNFFINDELVNDTNYGVSLNTIKKWLFKIKKGKEISNYN